MDCLFVLSFIVVITAQMYLFLGNTISNGNSIVEIFSGGLQNSTNIQKISLPIFPILFLLPFRGFNYPLIAHTKNIVVFYKIQLAYYYLLFIFASLLSLLLLVCLNHRYVFLTLNAHASYSLLLYFISLYVYLRIIYLFYSMSNSKLVALILTYLYNFIENSLSDIGIHALFSRGIIIQKTQYTFGSLFGTLCFILSFYLIVEVLERWLIWEKQYYK
ncbi:hypothetical protein IGI37_003721 [Enterococcus sp. AZ194]